MNNCTEQAHFLEVQIISTLRFSEYRPTPINMHRQNDVLYSRKNTLLFGKTVWTWIQSTTLVYHIQAYMLVKTPQEKQNRGDLCGNRKRSWLNDIFIAEQTHNSS